MGLLSHYWTISPRLRHAWRPVPAPATRPWETAIDDPLGRPVRISGLLREEPDSGELLVLVHGLGGSVESHYMLPEPRAARAAGLSCPRINLRGCDRQSGDYYHAGLTADLHTARRRGPRHYRRIYLIGYSLGGTSSCAWRPRRATRGSPRWRRSAPRSIWRAPRRRSTAPPSGSTGATSWPTERHPRSGRGPARARADAFSGRAAQGNPTPAGLGRAHRGAAPRLRGSVRRRRASVASRLADLRVPALFSIPRAIRWSRPGPSAPPSAARCRSSTCTGSAGAAM